MKNLESALADVLHGRIEAAFNNCRMPYDEVVDMVVQEFLADVRDLVYPPSHNKED